MTRGKDGIRELSLPSMVLAWACEMVRENIAEFAKKSPSNSSQQSIPKQNIVIRHRNALYEGFLVNVLILGKNMMWCIRIAHKKVLSWAIR